MFHPPSHRCYLTVNGGAARIPLSMAHRAPFKHDVVLKAYAKTQSPLQDAQTPARLLDRLSELYYVRQHPANAIEWELVGSPAFLCISRC